MSSLLSVLPPTAAAPFPKARRLSASRPAVARGAPADATFDRLSSLAMRLLRVAHAKVSQLDGNDCLVVNDARGSALRADAQGLDTTESYCRRVIETGLPLCMDDVGRTCAFGTFGDDGQSGVLSYCGVPLVSSTGAILGTFSAGDTSRRAWTEEDLDTMRHLAAATVAEIELRTATRELADQSVRQAALLARTTDLICAADLDGRITYVNAAWERALGYTLDEARALNPVDLVVADFRESYHAFVRDLRRGEAADFEAVLLSKSGRRLVCSGQGWPHREDGEVTGMYSVYRDLTEHSRSEHARERLVSTLEASPDFVTIVTTQGRLVYLNRAARELVGLHDDVEASGVELGTLRTGEEAWRLVEEIIPLAVRNGVCFHESVLLDAGGNSVPVAQTVIAHRSTHPDKPPFFISVVARDLRERVSAEHDRHQSEERFRAAMEASMDGFFVMSSMRDAAGGIVDFRIEDVNQRACDMLTRPREVLVGQTAKDLWPSSRILFSELCAVVETGEVIEHEIAVTAQGMVPSWVQVQVVKVGDGIGATTRDISARKNAESALERERAFYAAMLEHLSEGIVACDAQGRVTLFNRATREFNGAIDSLGKADPSWSDSSRFEAGGVVPLPPQNTPLMRALRGELVVNHEVVVARPNEPARTLLANGRQFFDADGRLLGAVVASRDVTTQKVVEGALRDSEERFRSVVECLDEGLIIIDLKGVTIYANDRMRDITGYDPSELIGRRPSQVLLSREDGVDADDHGGDRRHSVGGRYEVEHIRKDGSSVWVEVSGVPYRDGTGTIVGTVGSVIDISERRRWEAALLEAKDEAERANQAKSAILSRASHELRTPLNSVIGFSGVLLKNRSGSLTENDLSYIQRIRSNGGHLLSLVNDILDIAKVEAGHMSVDLSTVSVSSLVRDVLATLEGRVLAKPSVSLEASMPDTLQPIITDAAKLRQVLTNLVGNAIKFTQAGRVIVTVVNDDTDHPRTIIVEDTGCGIAPGSLESIFEAFEQSESAQVSDEPGTGLGLSIARSFCDLLGYRISVESELGRGSRFIVQL
ncbi:MAG: PAS domain S-box protein [bacterium]